MAKQESDLDDPTETVGVTLDDDLEEVAENMVDKFVVMGYDEEAIWALFCNPSCKFTHAVLQQKGEAYVRSLIRCCQMTWV